MAELLLGIDVGTSAVKAGLFDAEGPLFGLGRTAHAVSAPRPTWAECDPELWWRGILKSLAEACRQADVGPQDVAAVGMGVLFPVVVPLDRNARALHPAILYSDQRSLNQVRAIEDAIGRKRYEGMIGNNLVPGTCAVTSMAWLRDEKPEAYSKAATLASGNTFVAARLTGEFCADPSMVGLSGLVDISDPWRWSADLCEQVGIDADRLPRIAGAAEVIGGVSQAAARETGLRPGTPVVCGAGDVIVSAVGAGALSPDTLVYIAGSTDSVAMPVRQPTSGRRWACTGYVPRDTWLGIGANTSSGVSVEWFAREVLDRTGDAGLREMTQLAATSPPGSNRLLFLPYLQGERTPVWDPLARGMFVGLTSATTRADMARAVFEGTSFALRQLVDCAEDAAGQAPREIRAVGGGTNNDLWNQIKADVLQRPLQVLGFQETGALGGALLAGLGAGLYASFEEAVTVARSVGGTRTVEPDPMVAGLYDELFNLYERLYPQTQQIAHGLAAES